MQLGTKQRWDSISGDVRNQLQTISTLLQRPRAIEAALRVLGLVRETGGYVALKHGDCRKKSGGEYATKSFGNIVADLSRAVAQVDPTHEFKFFGGTASASRCQIPADSAPARWLASGEPFGLFVRSEGHASWAHVGWIEDSPTLAQAEQFGRSLRRSTHAFILNTALPQFDAHDGPLRTALSRPEFRLRAVILDPCCAAATERSEDMGEAPDFLRGRNLRRIVDLDRDHGRHFRGAEPAMELRLMDSPMPYVIYGTNEVIYLGWLHRSLQSLMTPHQVIVAGSPMYSAIRSYFEGLWMRLPRVDWENAVRQATKAGPSVASLRKQLKYQVHVGFPLRLRDCWRERVPRPNEWDEVRIEQVLPTAGGSRAQDAHDVPGGPALVLTSPWYGLNDALALATQALNALAGEHDCRVEVERRLYRSSKQNRSTNQDIDPVYPTSSSGIPGNGHVDLTEKSARFETHYVISSDSPLSLSEVAEVVSDLGIRFDEAALVDAGRRVIFTTFFSKERVMEASTVLAEEALRASVEKTDGALSVKILAEQLIMCAHPRPLGSES